MNEFRNEKQMQFRNEKQMQAKTLTKTMPFRLPMMRIQEQMRSQLVLVVTMRLWMMG